MNTLQRLKQTHFRSQAGAYTFLDVFSQEPQDQRMRTGLRNLLLAFSSATALASQPADRPAKQPWEWSDEERIVLLMDHSAAARRLEEARARGQFKPAEGPLPPGVGQPVDVISGERDPHLFMPHQLFTSLASLGFAEDGHTREVYRLSKEEKRREAGLPDDMWERLEQAAADYLDARRREREIGLSTIPQAQKSSLLRSLGRILCREGYQARIAAETEFGPAFRKFLYTAIAPGKSSLVYRYDRQDLESLSRGCE